MKYRYFLFFCLVISHLTSRSQVSPDIAVTAEYDSLLFPRVVEDLENRYKVHFYYKQAWVDSLYITYSAREEALARMLENILSPENIRIYISADREVFLTKEYSIQPDLPDRYFEKEARPEAITTNLSVFGSEEGREVKPALTNPEDILFTIGDPLNPSTGQTVAVAGYVRDAKTGEPLEGVSVFKPEPLTGTITNSFGYYVLTLPKGNHEVFFRYVGMKETKRQIEIHGEGTLNVEMEEEIIALKEVVIVNERSSVESVQTGVAKIDIDEIKAIPTVLGEADVMKITLSLPGVQSVGEGASGFNVRGGNTDQNLITLNDAVIYNPNHLFGFFSAFNPDVIKSANLYKSGIQAQYGGRVSSVFDVDIRDGNKKKFLMAGGISPITSKLSFEGPLGSNEAGSYILGIRSTYSNWLLGLLDNPGLSSSRAFFGDVIGKVSRQLNEKNSLSVSAYHSRDNFRLNSDTVFHYSNTNASVKVRHIFNNRFSGLFSSGISNYTYEIGSDLKPINAFDLDYYVSQAHLKADFELRPSSAHHARFGVQMVGYSLNPGSIAPVGDSSVIRPVELNRENGLEAAVYLGDEYEFSTRLSVYAGLRLSGYALLGPGEVYSYLSTLPRDVNFITDTTRYTSGSLIRMYGGLEPRISARYKLAEELSVKMSYDRTMQYIHMLTNTVAVSPTDTWRLSNTYLKPQTGNQIASGIYWNIPQKGLEFSVEAYAKFLNNIPEYKAGADLIVNEAIETDVLSAIGRSFGIELLARKKSGKLNGWVSYTFARALVKADSEFPEERINNGNFYPSNFDRPHNLSVVTNYKVNRRFNATLNFTYNTGRPTTIPITRYQVGGVVLPFFSERNKYRTPDYLRLDVAINMEGNHKVNKLIHSSWSISIYNLTGRNNAYSVFSTVEARAVRTWQLSVFSQAIPTLTYNFKFI